MKLQPIRLAVRSALRSNSLGLMACAIFAILFLPGFSGSAQPANDNFANRIFIGTNASLVSGTLSNATSESGEPLLDGVSSGQTAWWSWVAPSNGILTISATASNFNPLLTVFTGDQLTDLSLIASNNYLMCYSDGDCGCHWRMRDGVTFHVFRGESYQISVDSPVVTDASMEWTDDPAIVESGGLFLAPINLTPGVPAAPVETAQVCRWFYDRQWCSEAMCNWRLILRLLRETTILPNRRSFAVHGSISPSRTAAPPRNLGNLIMREILAAVRCGIRGQRRLQDWLHFRPMKLLLTRHPLGRDTTMARVRLFSF